MRLQLTTNEDMQPEDYGNKCALLLHNRVSEQLAGPDPLLSPLLSGLSRLAPSMPRAWIGGSIIFHWWCVCLYGNAYTNARL